jgi:hypothetical protein
MNLEAIKEIINDEIPGKDVRIMQVLAQDPDSATILIRLISMDRYEKTEALAAMNAELCRAHFYIADYVRPEKKEKKGLTRAFLLQEIKDFYKKHRSAVMHFYSQTPWGQKYL